MAETHIQIKGSLRSISQIVWFDVFLFVLAFLLLFNLLVCFVINCLDIKDVLEGQQTEVFKQCTQRTLKKASFSIIYGAKLKTLDVVAKSQEEAQLWTKGLKGLMKANKVGKLHKVVQILVDVPYVDITKPKGKEPTRDPNSKQQFSAELIQTIEHTLRESKKTFEVILKLSDSKHVLVEYTSKQINKL